MLQCVDQGRDRREGKGVTVGVCVVVCVLTFHTTCWESARTTLPASNHGRASERA
jgi:hypothetical protein